MKNLFIPLKKEWFLLLESRIKNTEYRAYGPRWNELTCTPGRMATLSLGYNGRRIERQILALRIITFSEAPPEAREIYPTAKFIAAIDFN